MNIHREREVEGGEEVRRTDFSSKLLRGALTRGCTSLNAQLIWLLYYVDL